MKRTLEILNTGCFAAAACLALCATATHRAQVSRQTSDLAAKTSQSQHAASITSRAQLPLSFEENVGQTDATVKYMARGDGYTVFLTRNEAVLSLRRSPRRTPKDGTQQVVNPGGAVVKIGLIGAKATPEIDAGQVQPGHSNYFIGNDRSRWLHNVRHYAEIKYREVYPGIEVVYHGNQRQLEQDFVLAPGADTKKIVLRVDGAERLSLDSRGNLAAGAGTVDLVLRKPTAYQETSGKRVEVAANFVLRESGRVGIRVGDYDHQQPLIIDPVLDYSTLVGEGGPIGAASIAVDAAGNAYVTGSTSATNFPTTNGVYQSTFPNGASSTTFVTKMNSTGTGLIYSTFLGGTGGAGESELSVDANGNVFVSGSTSATDFPVTQSAYQSTATKGGVYVTELDPNGATLLYSTYLAGSNGGENPVGIRVDTNDNAYVLGRTYDTDFPITPSNAFQTSNPTDMTNPNKGTIFLSRIDPSKSGAASLIYSTFLGGSKVEFPTSLAVDGNGNAYLTGNTSSADFPMQNAYTTSVNNQYGNVFISRIDTTKSGAASLIYSTYFGGAYNGFGTASDVGGGIAVQPNSIAVVVGYTYSNTGQFPLTGNALETSGNAPWSKAFLARFDTTQSGTASLLYSTLWGGTTSDLAFGGTLDAAGNIYMVGATSDNDFPVTAGAPMAKFPGRECAFVSGFDPTGTKVLFSSYWGGGVGAGNAAYAVAVDSASPANVYFSGVTSTNFPTTPGAFQAKFSGTYDVFMVKMSPGAAQPVFASPAAVAFGTQVLHQASNAQTVTLINSTSAAVGSIAIGFTGGNAADFSETNTCGASLAASSQCTISIKFTPSQTLVESATLNITDIAAGSPQTVTLSGTGTAVSLSAMSLSFGNQAPNTTSAPQTVTLTNNGTTALAINSIAVTGNNSAFFPETNTCGVSVAAGGNCTISVSFAPTSLAYETATLQIADGDPGSPQTVALSGTGGNGVPALTVSPMSLNFGNQPANSPSSIRAVTVTNTGSSTITFNKISFTGTNAADFAETDNCGASVAGGANCTIGVIFTPATEAAETATLQISDSDAGSPQTVVLSGTGTSPVTVSPTALNFGNQAISSTSSSKVVILTNGGASALTITKISFTGTNAADFAETDTCGASVGAGKNCTIGVTFTPSNLGAEAATLQISDSDPLGPQAVLLAGLGVSAVTVSPTALSFGSQTINSTSSPKTLTLKNGATSALTISKISFTGTNAADFAETDSCGTSLAAGQNCTISVTFKPATTAPENAILQINDSDLGSPQTAGISGTGVSAVTVSPTSISFGNQTENSTSAPQTVTLTNGGKSALTVSKVSFTGTNAVDFAETDTCGTSVAAGQNCTISVTFTPATQAYETATMQISDSDTSSPQTVSLSGTGGAPPPADFSVAFNPAQGSVKAGGTASFSVTVTSINSFASAVSLSCSGLPTGSACSFSPASLTPTANSTATSTATITTTKRSLIVGGRRPNGPSPLIWLCTILSLVLALFAARIMVQRTPRRLIWTFAALVLVALTGCSGLSTVHTTPAQTGTPAGTYTITVTANAGALNHPVSYVLTVN